MPATIERRRALILSARAIAQRAADENRQLTESEHAEFSTLNAEADRLAADEQRAAESAATLADLESRPVTRRGSAGNPLAVSARYLDAVQHAIDNRESGRFDVEERAALATSTFGAGRTWTSNELDGPAGSSLQPRSR